MNHKSKIKAFFEIAHILNVRFNVTPLLYGSLGLEYITGKDLCADDIDILIPKAYIEEKWSEFKEYFEDLDYVLVDEHEHTFEKDNISYSFAKLEELSSFAGIILSEIDSVSIEEVSFMILDLEQYYSVYNSSIKDGYRINVKEKNDSEKLALIRSLLSGDKEYPIDNPEFVRREK